MLGSCFLHGYGRHVRCAQVIILEVETLRLRPRGNQTRTGQNPAPKTKTLVSSALQAWYGPACPKAQAPSVFKRLSNSSLKSGVSVQQAVTEGVFVFCTGRGAMCAEDAQVTLS